MRWVRIIGVVAVGGSLLAQAASASEVDILLNKLVERGVLSQADATAVRTEVAQEIKTAQAQAPTKETPLPDSSRNWKWSGDLRLRNEYRNRTGSGNDVNRQRIRFRYGFDAKVADHLKVGARLVTGSTTDPTAANQSFNTSFNHKNFLLDRAFVEYSPEVPGLDQFKVVGGMFEVPFWYVGPLVWDDELNFDGAAVHLAKVAGPVTIFTNDGVFALQTDITEAASLWSLQGGLILRPFADAAAEPLQHLQLTAAVAYHDYKNVSNPTSESTAQTTAGGLKGNSGLAADYNLVNPSLELASQVAGVPVSLFGDLVRNTNGSFDGNNGFQIGLKAGQAKKPFDLKGGVEGGYFFERLEPDATFGAFTDGDFGGGGTNHRGHVWWLKLATLKNSSVALKYFNTRQVEGSKNHFDAFQADWTTKF